MTYVMIGIIVLFTFIMFTIIKYTNFQIVGVTFSPEHASTNQVKQLQNKFKIKQILISLCFIGLTFLSQLELFQGWRDFSQLLIFFIYIIVSYLSVTLLQRQLKKLKAKENWIYESQKRIVDLSVTREKGKAAPKKIWLWLVWLINWIPFTLAWINGQSWSVLFPLLIVGLIMIIIPLSYPSAIRSRTAFVSKNSEITQSYMRRYERINGLTYIQVMILVSLFLLTTTITLIFNLSNFWFIIILLIFLICLIGLIFYSSNTISSLQNEYFVDESWLLTESKATYKWGAYYDPDDPRLFVPKISGIGVTINVGRPAGKIINAILMLAIIAILIMVLFMSMTSYDVTFDSNQFQIDVPMYGIEMEFDKIESIELSQTNLSGIRTNGFGGQEKSFGYFNLDEFGPARLYVYNDQAYHINIHLKDGNDPQWIIFNQSTYESTESLYEDLIKQWEMQQ